jgi:hypothetical protein
MASNSDSAIKTKAPLTWELRISRRSRYAKLQIKPYGGLEVVIPPYFPRRMVPQFVENHASWVRCQLEKQSAICEAIQLPEQINLAFDQTSLRVIYGEDKATPQLDDHLYIAASEYHECVNLLRNWIRNKAWEFFPDMLEKIADQTGLSYRKLTIRSQKTRWGSCTNGANISLNDQLLFLPQASVKYLMIHELCHTRYLNHARAFWQLVEYHCPDYRKHEGILGQTRHAVPEWFVRDLYG